MPPGAAVITPGFSLPALFVIHTVGPVWSGGDTSEAEMLASAYVSSIELADSAELATIAFPSISTGIFGYPTDLAAPIALDAVSGALERADHVASATFVLFDRTTLDAYQRAMGSR